MVTKITREYEFTSHSSHQFSAEFTFPKDCKKSGCKLHLVITDEGVNDKGKEFSDVKIFHLKPEQNFSGFSIEEEWT